MIDFALIFDVDGVILNSTSYNKTSIDKLLGTYGFTIADLPDSSNEDWRGRSLKDILTAAKSKYGVDLDVETFSRQSGEISFAMMEADGQLQPDPFLIKLLKELKNNNIPMGIGSSSRRWRIDHILKIFNLADYFSVVITAEDVATQKPDPNIFLTVAERLSVPTNKCIVVEDAPSGIEAAKRAGMKVAGFNGFIKEDLAGVDLLINNWSDLSYLKLLSLFNYD